MTKLRVATWNAEGMFVAGSMTRRATPADAIRVLKKLDADIVVVPEFGIISKLDEQTDVAIRALGYEHVTMAYRDPRAKGSGLAILSRFPITAHEVIKLGEIKGAIKARVNVDGQIINVLGVHLDDRSEKFRLVEVEDLISHIQSLHGETTLMMGDFNAMHSSSRFARLARSNMTAVVERITPHTKLRSVIARVREMALGTVISMIESQTELNSLDPKLRRTVSARQRGLELLPAIRLAKIDWIFGSPDIHARHYRVLPDIDSDHRPVAADIEI